MILSLNTKKKWGVFGYKVETKTFLLSYNLSSKVDLNIIPENIFSVIIENNLNRFKEASFYEVKNVYGKWFKGKVFPVSYMHKIGGVFYDENLNIISNIEEHAKSIAEKLPIVVKSSRDTFGGVDVNFVRTYEELLASLSKYDSLVCQELIKQNSFLQKINDSSINTVRTCLYRTKSGKFEILNHTMRFGINGSLDNETSGGIVCNLNEDGSFNDYAVDKYANKFFFHPNSGFIFKDQKVPFYNELNDVAKQVANEIILCRLISLDMCLDEDNNWRCIEINMFGQTIRFAQYAGKGFLGKYTDEVLDSIRLS